MLIDAPLRAPSLLSAVPVAVVAHAADRARAPSSPSPGSSSTRRRLRAVRRSSRPTACDRCRQGSKTSGVRRRGAVRQIVGKYGVTVIVEAHGDACDQTDRGRYRPPRAREAARRGPFGAVRSGIGLAPCPSSSTPAIKEVEAEGGKTTIVIAVADRLASRWLVCGGGRGS